MNTFSYGLTGLLLPTKSAPQILTPVEFARERLRFLPDPKQQAVLNSTAKRAILNCSRQWGKSTVTAAKAVHRAFTEPGCLVLVASRTERQSREFLRKAKDFVRELDLDPRGDGDNAVSVLFPNGSRIVGLPGTEGTIRGFSKASLVLIDEAAWVPDALYKALRPMLARSEGDLWMMSTPHGAQGFFWETWISGAAEWHKIQATAEECAWIAPAFLESELADMGRAWYGQEYLCEFVSNGTQFFDRRIIEGALDDAEAWEI